MKMLLGFGVVVFISMEVIKAFYEEKDGCCTKEFRIGLGIILRQKLNLNSK